MRRRSLTQQILLGVVVAILVAAAAVVVLLAGGEALDAVRDGDGTAAIERGLIALVAPIVPVIALAAYGHWLGVTERPHRQHDEHVPSRVEDWLLGAATAAVVVAAWPIVRFAYRETTSAFEDRDLAFAVGYGLLGVAYLAFVVFCVERYVRWLR